MAFPNLGQMPASTQVAMPGPGMAGPPRLPMRKPLPMKKKPALNPLAARQALLAGMQGGGR